MIHHEFVHENTVLCVRPDDRLSKEDFAALAAAVDPVIEKKGKLDGLLIDAPSFPGWENFEGFVSHMRFVRNHHEKVAKVALVSDSRIAAAAPKLAKHFLAAEVKHFPVEERDAAIAWITG